MLPEIQPTNKITHPRNTQASSNEQPTISSTPASDPRSEDLGEQMKAHFGWPSHFAAREFQIQGTSALLRGHDVLVHAGTGSGKTTLVAGPHVHETSKGKVTILVSPLIALQNEQVETLKTEFKLDAVAINSNLGGCTSEVMADICRGKWQVVILSPEMLLSKRFIAGVLRDPDFRKRVLMVAIDEAHVVSHWGEGFRKKYGELGIIRALLPPKIPMLAMSATLPSRVRRDILTKLQYGKDFEYIDIGNDRANVSLLVRAIQHPLHSYRDLDFIIPLDTQSALQIPKTFVYADNVVKGIDIEDHLRELLPLALRSSNVVQTYSAAYSSHYRNEVMQRFKSGEVRVLVCTDAAGMGCNIPDIDIVVQWKLPGTISAFVQRAGRAARAQDRHGLAVLLAERSAYTEDLRATNNVTEDTMASSKSLSMKKAKGNQKKQKWSAKDRAAYAEACGIHRGSHGGRRDTNYTKTEPPLDCDAPNEGLYVLVQTGVCRRQVLTKIYHDHGAVHSVQPTVPCCDLCSPELLDRVRPSPPQPTARQSKIRRGRPCRSTQRELHKWRTTVFDRDYNYTLFAASGILKDETIELLSSVGPIKSKSRLEKVLAGQWTWFEKYGDELWDFISQLEMPAFVPKPTPSRGTKRGAESNEESESNKRQSRGAGVNVAAEDAATTSPTTLTRTRTTSSSTPSVVSSNHLLQNPYARLVSQPQYALAQPLRAYPNVVAPAAHYHMPPFTQYSVAQQPLFFAPLISPSNQMQPSSPVPFNWTTCHYPSYPASGLYHTAPAPSNLHPYTSQSPQYTADNIRFIPYQPPKRS